MAIWIDDECLGKVDNGKAVRFLKIGFDDYKRRVKRFYKKYSKGEIDFRSFTSYEEREAEHYKGMITMCFWLDLLSEESFHEYSEELSKISIAYTDKAIDKIRSGD